MNYDDGNTRSGKPEYYGMTIKEAKTLAVRNGYNLIREVNMSDFDTWVTDNNYVCSRMTFAIMHGRVLRAVVR